MVPKLKQKYTSTKLTVTCDTHRHSNATETVVSSPGRDSRDIRSSRLAEATQKPLGTNAL